MSNDSCETVRLKVENNDPYSLLRSYAKESKIMSIAYHKSEVYYRWMFKCFNYPVVVLSAVNTVCTGIGMNGYILLGISLCMLILLGFDKLIDPKDKSVDANKFSVEYGEISGNIKQFIMSNDRSRDDIKNYSEIMYSLLVKWKAFNPPIKDVFVEEAQKEKLPKVRDSMTHMKPQTPKKKSSLTGLERLDMPRSPVILDTD